MNKNLGKALSALTLVIAGTSGVAMANDNVAQVSPSAEGLAQATAIQFDEFTALGNEVAITSEVDGTHIHNHDNDYAAAALAASTRGANFDV